MTEDLNTVRVQISHDEQVVTQTLEVTLDSQRPAGVLVSPEPGTMTHMDSGFVEVVWTDTGASGLDLSSIDAEDLSIVGVSIDRIESLAQGHIRYWYNDDGDTLDQGTISVAFPVGAVQDLAGNFSDPSSASFDLDAEGAQGTLLSPVPNSTINQDQGYVDIQWTDRGLAGIDETSFDTADISVGGVSIDRVEERVNNVVRYWYSDDDETLSAGTIQVLSASGSVLDRVSNPSDALSASFTLQELVTPDPEADLQVTVSDLKDPVEAGEDVTYTIVIRNLGPDPATAVTATHTLPSEFVFVSASSDSVVSSNPIGLSESDGVVTGLLGDLASGATVEFSVIARTSTSGVFQSTAEVVSPTIDPTAGNNSATESMTVNRSCFSVDSLTVGSNRLQYSCATPGGYVAFVIGAQAGSHYFHHHDTWIDIADPSVPAIGVGNIDGIATVLIEMTDDQRMQDMHFQAFELVPEIKVSKRITRASSYDVNQDGIVTPLDTLNVINELNRMALEGESTNTAAVISSRRNYEYDANLDGKVSAIDALVVMNQLSRMEWNVDPLAASSSSDLDANDASLWLDELLDDAMVDDELLELLAAENRARGNGF